MVASVERRVAFWELLAHTPAVLRKRAEVTDGKRLA